MAHTIFNFGKEEIMSAGDHPTHYVQSDGTTGNVSFSVTASSTGWNTDYIKMRFETEEEKQERLAKEAKERFEKLATPFRPTKIIISGKWTHCFFPDGSKEGKKISVLHDGDIEDFDPEIGVAMCIAKYIYTSRCQFVKQVDKNTHYNDPDMKDFIEANREEFYAKRKLLKEKEAKKTNKAKPLSA